MKLQPLRTVPLLVRLTDELHVKLLDVAADHGLCKTDMVRQLVRSAHERELAGPARRAAAGAARAEAARLAAEERIQGITSRVIQNVRDREAEERRSGR